MAQILLGLGSNVGNRLCFLQEALDCLSGSIKNMEVSSVYETVPMYVEDQDAFLNAALIGNTDLSPLDLLRFLKSVEANVGRNLAPRYGPREIDVDLLAYGSLSYRFRDRGKVLLQAPHPRIAERRFVLQPLFDIAPKFNLPGLGVVAELLNRTNGQAQDVRRLDDALLSVHGA